MMNRGISVIKATGETIQLNINDNKHLFLFHCNDIDDAKEVCIKLLKVDYEEHYRNEFELKMSDGESLELNFSDFNIDESQCDNIKEDVGRNSRNLNQGIEEVMSSMRKELLDLGLL